MLKVDIVTSCRVNWFMNSVPELCNKSTLCPGKDKYSVHAAMLSLPWWMKETYSCLFRPYEYKFERRKNDPKGILRASKMFSSPLLGKHCLPISKHTFKRTTRDGIWLNSTANCFSLQTLNYATKRNNLAHVSLIFFKDDCDLSIKLNHLSEPRQSFIVCFDEFCGQVWVLFHNFF